MGSMQSLSLQDPPNANETLINSDASTQPPTAANAVQAPVPTPSLPSIARSLFPPKFVSAVSDLLYNRLPPELIPLILEYAAYYSESNVSLARNVALAAGARNPRVRPGLGGQWRNGQELDLQEEIDVEDAGLTDEPGALWYLVSQPIGYRQEEDRLRAEDPPSDLELVSDSSGGDAGGASKSWIRKIVVHTMSKDQGWSSSSQEHYGTYEQSYTWFELSLLRNGKDVEGSRIDFQHNVHAGQYFKEHVNTFEPDHKLLAMAKPGDRVVLWARAQFPGWVNHIRSASIAITESPFPPQL
ncbi:hypothetical protein BD324DRAFT_195136 [Kockovaella imperatae]|uniref:Uncharacterized protein n=1 Tax=Kockovaella imperatae TaxID=4999 RepID=A0A1Y1U7Q6_9TREE|nr:hypothetical protein BD324DRAFT_195136 [Kockovaella imperatae]ORX34069.1 hypothetical protein BD324DRAFT_195136 [Kockovaella imperatae]